MPRLIRCLDCLSVEVLPDFLGSPEEEAEDPLKMLIAVSHRGPLNREQLRHRPSGALRVREIRDELIVCDVCRGHGNCRVCKNVGKIQRWPHQTTQYLVQPDDWLDPQKQDQILRRLWDGHPGYPDEFYAARDTFREDAGVCYNIHNRPGSATGPYACIDYEDDDMRLTDVGWEARSAAEGTPRKHVYLCTFCPYESVVVTRKRIKRGDYDKD